MHLNFTKVRHFSRLLRAGNQTREFNFKKLTSESASEVFHVDVADERGDRIVFRLRQTEKGWDPQPASLPKWVEEALPQLCEIIVTAETE